jgi:hypothetical protein
MTDSWLGRLAAGEVSAAETLWQHFCTRLSRYAEVCLRKASPNLVEADDVTLSVFKSLCRMTGERKIPSVRDPEQLWPLLAVIAARKVQRLARRHRIGRAGKQIVESDLVALDVDPGEVPLLGQVLGREPPSELIATMREEWSELMRRLEGQEPEIARLWLEDATVEHIAEQTGVSRRTVARKLEKIRRIIRDMGREFPDSASESGE